MGGGRRGPHSPGRRGPHSPGRRGPHSPGRGVSPQDEGWNTVPISKNRPIDTSRLSKITKVRKGGCFLFVIADQHTFCQLKIPQI